MDSDGYKIPRRFHVSSNMLGEFAQKRGRGVIVETMAMDARSHPLTDASKSTVSCHVVRRALLVCAASSARRATLTQGGVVYCFSCL